MTGISLRWIPLQRSSDAELWCFIFHYPAQADNLSYDCRQAIIGTNDGISLITLQRIGFNKNETKRFLLTKLLLKSSSVILPPFCPSEIDPFTGQYQGKDQFRISDKSVSGYKDYILAKLSCGRFKAMDIIYYDLAD